ncbi:MAG TPA: DUF896 domain-containing protein [Clostridia bacterium]|nr:DUF896 domain-containing protein [Clostridia bacterium]HPA61487.1 DUF896 domain-containing protein [Clostridia bacterium]HPY93933.1 DUF896 domain-containing protein [Clostridia bacterium]HQA97803.1 DUF896 domain-containing protein [Clostridia bacterium]HQO55938.1 DUF896 domain-containing protein [Clostridia bacterium]
MDKDMIRRINELARKKKEAGLCEEELAEQAALRAQYLQAFRNSLEATLEHIWIENEDGVYEKLQKKQ